MRFDERVNPSESHTLIVSVDLDSVERFMIRVFGRVCN